MLNMRNIFAWPLFGFILTALLPAAIAGAQEAAGGTQPPVAYASVSALNGILTPLQQTAQNMLSDLGKMRIEKWKTDASNKQQALANMGASFKLYRNLDALYDVFSSVAESAGAFGNKEEFQSLSNDLAGLESARR